MLDQNQFVRVETNPIQNVFLPAVVNINLVSAFILCVYQDKYYLKLLISNVDRDDSALYLTPESSYELNKKLNLGFKELDAAILK